MNKFERYEKHPKAKEIADHVREILNVLGLDVNSEGLRRTPIRVAATLLKFTEGYGRKVKLKRTYTERSNLVANFGIPFLSLCEHHLMPFVGYVDIGYIPRKNVTGLSKLDKLVQKYALRFQIQERMTDQIANELWETLEPHGVIVVTEALHTCKIIEGHSPTMYVCSACRGVFLWNAAPRSEFMSLREQNRRKML